VAAQPADQLARRLERSLGSLVAAAGGQDRVDAVLDQLGERARPFALYKGGCAARLARADLRDQPQRSAGQLAAEPRGAADDVCALRPARAQVLDQAGAQVVLDLVAGVGHSNLGQRRQRRGARHLLAVHRRGMGVRPALPHAVRCGEH
jgi:hypothetical protein